MCCTDVQNWLLSARLGCTHVLYRCTELAFVSKTRLYTCAVQMYRTGYCQQDSSVHMCCTDVQNWLLSARLGCTHVLYRCTELAFVSKTRLYTCAVQMYRTGFCQQDSAVHMCCTDVQNWLLSARLVCTHVLYRCTELAIVSKTRLYTCAVQMYRTGYCQQDSSVHLCCTDV